MKKWANELNVAFLKEEDQMAKEHMKKYSPSLATNEMQIKALCHQEDHEQQMLAKMWGEKEPSCTASGNVSYVQTLWKTV
jgi:hypothetical protein